MHCKVIISVVPASERGMFAVVILPQWHINQMVWHCSYCMEWIPSSLSICSHMSYNLWCTHPEYFWGIVHLRSCFGLPDSYMYLIVTWYILFKYDLGHCMEWIPSLSICSLSYILWCTHPEYFWGVVHLRSCFGLPDSYMYLIVTWYILFKYDLGQKFYSPQVQLNRGWNSWPPEYDSTFHVTETSGNQGLPQGNLVGLIHFQYIPNRFPEDWVFFRFVVFHFSQKPKQVIRIQYGIQVHVNTRCNIHTCADGM